MREKSEELIKNCQNEEQSNHIKKNITKIEQKWQKLKKSVETRTWISIDYLEFLKILNKFRNLALDLQELFKNANDYSGNYIENFDSSSSFENYVKERIKTFEMIYKELNNKGERSIEKIKKVNYL